MDNAERRVMIFGQVCKYEEKAPFVPSGKSVQGAIEYRSSSDELRCHECGEWYETLIPHVKVHGLGVAQYKEKHGLREKTALCGLKISAAMRSRAKMLGFGAYSPFRDGGLRPSRQYKRGPRLEQRNLKGTCQAQLLDRLKRIAADLARTPTEKEMNAAGFNASDAARYFGMSVSELQVLAGLKPNSRGGQFGHKSPHQKYSKEILSEVLKDFWAANKRIPRSSDYKSGLMPRASTYVRYFGSMANAYKEAGLFAVYIAGKAA